MNQIAIDNYKKRLIIDNYRCCHPGCTEKATERAHLIGQGKHARAVVKRLWLELFGEELKGNKMEGVIHHWFNIRSSCSKHNSYFSVSIIREKKVKRILENIHEEINGK